MTHAPFHLPELVRQMLIATAPADVPPEQLHNALIGSHLKEVMEKMERGEESPTMSLN